MTTQTKVNNTRKAIAVTPELATRCGLDLSTLSMVTSVTRARAASMITERQFRTIFGYLPHADANGTDPRGSSRNKRQRKAWLVSPAAPFGGNGTEVLCVHGCGALVTVKTMHVDRIVPGGSYCYGTRRGTVNNCQPSCGPCNLARSNDVTWVHPSRRTV